MPLPKKNDKHQDAQCPLHRADDQEWTRKFSIVIKPSAWITQDELTVQHYVDVGEYVLGVLPWPAGAALPWTNEWVAVAKHHLVEASAISQFTPVSRRVDSKKFAQAAEQLGIRPPFMSLKRACDATEVGSALRSMCISRVTSPGSTQQMGSDTPPSSAALSAAIASAASVGARTVPETAILKVATELEEALKVEASFVANILASDTESDRGSVTNDLKASRLEKSRLRREIINLRRETKRLTAQYLDAERNALASLAMQEDEVAALQKKAQSLRRLVAVAVDDNEPVARPLPPVRDLRNERGGCQPFVDELAGRGLDYPPAWAMRFLIAVLAAQRTGALVLLAGSTGTGKTQIVRTTAEILGGAGSADIPVRPDWLNASDLLGYVDPLRGIFAPSDFVTAVRSARRQRLLNEVEVPPPFLLLLDELNLARVENFGADLLSILERNPGPARSIRLYPEDQNRIWLEELERLRKSGESSLRFEELKAYFDPRNTIEVDQRLACRLLLPENLVVCGTLNTDRHTHELSPKVLDRALVLQSPPLDVDKAFERKGPPRGAISRLRILPAPRSDPRTSHPIVFEQFQHAASILGECGVAPSRRMVRTAEAFVAEASRWWGDDPGPGKGSNELTAALLHMLLIPRIESSRTEALKPVQTLRDWLVRLVSDDHDVLQEVEVLLGQAKSGGKFGDLRGLR